MKDDRYPGTFIVVEGPDASGKQTQTSRIAEWVRKKDYSSISDEEEEKISRRMPEDYPSEETEDKIEDGVWRLSFPTYNQTAGGRVVEAYLQGRLGDREKLDTLDIVDIYAADRKQFKTLIEDFLDAGGIIICDRYREANLIHQLVDFEGDKWKEMLEKVKTSDRDLPASDKIFYLNITPDEALRRMEDKDKDIHELDKDYMKACNRNGLKVAHHENWEIIDAERSREEVEKDILGVLEDEIL